MAPSEATGALVDESSGCGRWTGAGHRSACGPPPGVLLPGARVAAGSSRNPPAPASKRLAPPGGAASQILGVVATPFTLLTTHQNAPEAYPSLTSYAADH